MDKAISGDYKQDVNLTSDQDANLRFPISFDIAGDNRQALQPMIELAAELARLGQRPVGNQLSITPGDLTGLGMTLPSGLLTPTIRLNVDEAGELIPQGQ